MKRIVFLLAALLMFSGCSLFENEYIAVELHDEAYEVAVDSGKLSVDSYLSLKNALLNLIQDGVEEGRIQAKGYSGNLGEDLGKAVYEVSQVDPLGAFAVEYMTYEYSKVVSYYEIEVHTTFCRSPEEIDTVTYLTSSDSVSGLLHQAFHNYSPVLRIRLSDYDDLDLDAVAQELYQDDSTLFSEPPALMVECYPQTGSQRILEITISYPDSISVMSKERQELENKLEEISKLYGSQLNELNTAKRFYNRLGRDSIMALGELTPVYDSVYGALILEEATPYGYARAFSALLDRKEITNSVISCTYNGEPHSICFVNLDGSEYYIDPSCRVKDKETDVFLLGTAELLAMGYDDFPEDAAYVELLPSEKPQIFLDPGVPE